MHFDTNLRFEIGRKLENFSIKVLKFKKLAEETCFGAIVGRPLGTRKLVLAYWLKNIGQ
jgi:hypothetical protein